ncbi:MAG: tRNA (uridine(34)/cytosine(34)/5-carboxymethylaminomethyluridine(34)-2'-O)-methyltransferase TrmL [Gammaproteobacteria bacterium]|nr:tRNA (uridine(34)/cytosine(34)/5-carboxymethylaminomethyluridine(34)-2'-O)-methyltransferase TrmL [Gammaproteobacteria bacterium]
MLHIALFEPEIPPNTGNIIRLCANTGYQLHLIHPLGFELSDKRMRRAGLDYHEWTNISHYDSLEDFLENNKYRRLFACSTHGKTRPSDMQFHKDDILLFGPETRGLPKDFLQALEPAHILRLPMLAESRSMNLSNSVAVMIYESWRQLNFEGAS